MHGRALSVLKHMKSLIPVRVLPWHLLKNSIMIESKMSKRKNAKFDLEGEIQSSEIRSNFCQKPKLTPSRF
jgi:hypothetical protein